MAAASSPPRARGWEFRGEHAIHVRRGSRLGVNIEARIGSVRSGVPMAGLGPGSEVGPSVEAKLGPGAAPGEGPKLGPGVGGGLGRAPCPDAGLGVTAVGSSFADLLAWVVGPPARARIFRGRAPGWWLRACSEELVTETGLDKPTVERVRGALALAGRVLEVESAERPHLARAAQVHAHMAPVYAGLEREAFHVLLLDGQHRLKRCELVSLGTLTASLVHPREVYRRAVREAAAAVIVAHNHPSGDPKPSREDREVTRRLREAGTLLGIPLLDHLVVAGDRFTSLREVLGF